MINATSCAVWSTVGQGLVCDGATRFSFFTEEKFDQGFVLFDLLWVKG